jgi:hypothetical protein
MGWVVRDREGGTDVEIDVRFWWRAVGEPLGEPLGERSRRVVRASRDRLQRLRAEVGRRGLVSVWRRDLLCWRARRRRSPVVASLSSGKTFDRGVGVWYLRCPRCGLGITPLVHRQAGERCLGCIARTGTNVELFNCPLAGQLLSAEDQLPGAEPAASREPGGSAAAETLRATTKSLPREQRVVARSRASTPSGASADMVADPRDARIGDVRAELRLAPTLTLVSKRLTSAARLTVGEMRPPSPLAASREPARPQRPRRAGRPRTPHVTEPEPLPAA